MYYNFTYSISHLYMPVFPSSLFCGILFLANVLLSLSQSSEGVLYS